MAEPGDHFVVGDPAGGKADGDPIDLAEAAIDAAGHFFDRALGVFVDLHSTGSGHTGQHQHHLPMQILASFQETFKGQQ